MSAVLLSKKDPHSPPAKNLQLVASIALGLTLSSLAIWWTFSSSDTGRLVQPGVRAAIAQELSSPAQNLGIDYTSSSSETKQDSNPITENMEPNSPEAKQDSNPITENVERGINSLIGPFPWQWESISWIAAGLDGLMMLVLWCLIVFGAIKFPSTRRISLILIAATLPLIAGEAYFHANYGITMRVRAHYLILLLPLIAVQIGGGKKLLAKKEKMGVC